MAIKLTINEATLQGFQGSVPRHVAVIMDGNGRWAVQRGMARIRGHHEGANAVRRVVESCRYLGVEILTLYAFSSQNWGRPQDEVSGLMTLFDLYIKKERKRLLQNGIRMQVIGDRGRLSPKLQKAIAELEARSAENTGMILQVAVSYGGREEIIQATRRIAEDALAGNLDPAQIDEALVSRYLYTQGRLDPDLVIRTSGECRVSNFLLWQIAYSELHITETLWPDFGEAQLIEAFEDFTGRQRRFGQTGAQVDDEAQVDAGHQDEG
ncbi:di-trans,poly-cis-decaprenylcistransferase [Lujinxingia litoralis]|uniref:Isoprenyl transferase n=1 Tax=Lujinxingia litoralis TaxID=2211119 RepID=A0A328C5H2_9DELT|nr:isoprenyl transferase [Lujinxingia litoralis]RAL21162.1 di-trans,poly-cis-decaprenylcistransferase [Lujinxingia litoralis]